MSTAVLLGAVSHLLSYDPTGFCESPQSASKRLVKRTVFIYFTIYRLHMDFLDKRCVSL